MIGKLIDLILKLTEMHFGGRAVLVRDLKILYDALQECHRKYLALQEIPTDDIAGRRDAEARHRKATDSLLKALYRFGQLFTIHSPERTWDPLASYAAMETRVHPKHQFQRIIEISLKDNQANDYVTAITTLRKYMRENLMPEEIYGKG